jgi:hypothetical protein
LADLFQDYLDRNKILETEHPDKAYALIEALMNNRSKTFL